MAATATASLVGGAVDLSCADLTAAFRHRNRKSRKTTKTNGTSVPPEHVCRIVRALWERIAESEYEGELSEAVVAEMTRRGHRITEAQVDRVMAREIRALRGTLQFCRDQARYLVDESSTLERELRTEVDI